MVHQARFTAPGRHLLEEDRLVLTSVGVDVGSSTSHLLFSRLELQRQDDRYATVGREVLYRSEILLTPYAEGQTIDRAALGRFVEREYRAAGLGREDVDSGALILTGVALQRRNARAIAELFAEETGRFVAVSAGDNLEATLAAHGSGAAALSATTGQTVLNVDVGGGTTKLAVCRQGQVVDLAVLDVGARLVAYDERRVVTRLEAAGQRAAAALGLDLAVGTPVAPRDLARLAEALAREVVRAMSPDGATSPPSAMLRSAPLRERWVDAIAFSGGVAEFIYGRQDHQFGDLGPLLAREIRARFGRLGAPVVELPGGIRATVIGAAQFTVQVSGSTIFLAPLEVVPVRNVPVVVPAFDWADELEPAAVAGAVGRALERFDLVDADGPVAIALRWEGSASFSRLDGFCRGVVEAMRAGLERGHPLIFVCEGDVGGLLGLHVREELGLDRPIISIDGVELREFDYVDVGALIPSSGAVPVVIKSLVFPAGADGGR